MVVPFDIVISRAAAEAMDREVNRFCNACGAAQKFRDKYRYVEPTPEDALEVARWEIPLGNRPQRSRLAPYETRP